jgi:hypothetical protein
VPAPISRYRSNPLVRPIALKAKAAARRGLGVQLGSPTHRVDLATSDAFSPTDASFAVHLRNPSPTALVAIERALLDLTLQDDTPAVEAVWQTETLWGRTALPGEPLLLFAPATGVRPSATLKDTTIDFPAEKGHGCNDREGIALVVGPTVRSGQLGRISICDVAPTLLWLMGSAPEGNGRVLNEAFRDQSSSSASTEGGDERSQIPTAGPAIDSNNEASRVLSG